MQLQKTEKRTESISIRLPVDLIQQLKDLADDEMRPISNMAAIFIRDGLAKAEKESEVDA